MSLRCLYFKTEIRFNVFGENFSGCHIPFFPLTFPLWTEIKAREQFINKLNNKDTKIV